jgi:hypothetical protein
MPPISETEPPQPQRGRTAEEGAHQPLQPQRGRTAEEDASEPPPPPSGRNAADRASEPAKPQRGLTTDEMDSDASGPERDLAAATSLPQKLWILLKPSFLLSQASGYPAGIKQFLWFCLILIYPAWFFMVLVVYPIVWVVGKVLFGIFWVLFWPVRRIWGDPEYGKDSPDDATKQ